MEWVTVERPGYFGKRREAKHREFDQRFGVGNWRIAWEWQGEYLEFAQAVLVYEEAYFRFMEASPGLVNELVREASDVYDDATTNVGSGLDYLAQETSRTHIQDIAIRRCIRRLGRRFEGSRLLRIRDDRGEHPLSLQLSPGRVPFHRPEFIQRPELRGWWQRGSVEAFYQSNKVLQVKA